MTVLSLLVYNMIRIQSRLIDHTVIGIEFKSLFFKNFP